MYMSSSQGKYSIVTKGYIRVVGNIPFKLFDEIGCDVGGVQTSVVLMQTQHSPRQHASPLV